MKLITLVCGQLILQFFVNEEQIREKKYKFFTHMYIGSLIYFSCIILKVKMRSKKESERI